MRSRTLDPPATDCASCLAWYAEAQRAYLLLELLAEDRFPDQDTFDRWMEAQMTRVYRSAPGGATDA